MLDARAGGGGRGGTAATPPRGVDGAPVADVNRPPRGLGADGRRLWKAVVDEYDLLGHQFELLRLACQAADRSAQARVVLDRDGLTVSTATGVKSHPAAAIELGARGRRAGADACAAAEIAGGAVTRRRGGGRSGRLTADDMWCGDGIDSLFDGGRRAESFADAARQWETLRQATWRLWAADPESSPPMAAITHDGLRRPEDVAEFRVRRPAAAASI
eukprot:gene30948-53177_t